MAAAVGQSVPSSSQNQTRSSQRNTTADSHNVCIVENDWDKYQPVNRSAWIRINDTPNPGVYRSLSFIDELERNPIRNSYRFKSDGRKREPFITAKGQELLPGAYNNDAIDMHYWLNKTKYSYGFKNIGRKGENLLNEGLIDKDMMLGPGQYNNEGHMSIDGEKMPSKHMAFKSRSKREMKAFMPKEGPCPGEYEAIHPQAKFQVRSSFLNTAPRFRSSHTSYPGPGTYDKSYQSPMPKTIKRMGQQHGLFFSSAFHN